MMLKPARLMLALIAVAAAPAFAQNVATVNGKAIPAAKVDQVVKQVVAQGQQPDSPQLREVKKELIGREVLLQEADKQGYGKAGSPPRSTMPVKALSSTPCWLIM
jgi:peptidyl-prolyl cis-trans isomerase C